MQKISKIMQMGQSGHLSSAQWSLLLTACTGVHEVAEKTCLSRQGNKLDKSLLQVDGFIGRMLTNATTGRRQLVSVQVPGDFVDFHAYPLKFLEHDVVALSPVTVAVFDHTALQIIFDQDPSLARIVWAMTLVDAAVQRHWTYRNAALRALPSVANLMCEFQYRLGMNGTSNHSEFDLPIRQSTFGAACGLSKEHISRIFRDLREAKICSISGRKVIVHDQRKLMQIAQFDGTYLYLAGERDIRF